MDHKSNSSHSRNTSILIRPSHSHSLSSCKTDSFHGIYPDSLYKFPIILQEKPSRSIQDLSTFILADSVDLKQTFSHFHQTSPFQRSKSTPSDSSSYISSYKNTLEFSGSYLKSRCESIKRSSITSELSGQTYLVHLHMDTGLSFSSVKSDEVVFNPSGEELSHFDWDCREIKTSEERTGTINDNLEIVELMPESLVDDSRLLYNSIDALRKADLVEEEDSINEEGSIKISAALRVFLSGQTASKDKLVDIENVPKQIDFKINLSLNDLACPLIRKVVVFDEPEELQIVETRDSRNTVKSLQLLFYMSAVGFSVTPQIEYSNTLSNSRADISKTSHQSPIISLFSSKILKQIKNLNVKLVSCGYEHAALVTSDGKVLTWGYGASGCLGLENKKSYSHPTALNSIFNKNILYLECGAYHTAAVSESFKVYTWGRGDVGQLGIVPEKLQRDEIGTLMLRPCKLKNLPDALSVACGEAHTLILTRQGNVLAFGWNEDGQLGTEDPKEKLVKIPEKIVKISAGALFSCALSENGGVFVWGSGEQGQLGSGSSITSVRKPLKVEGVSSIIDLTCGENSVLALSDSFKILGWGQGTVSSFTNSSVFSAGSDIVCFLPHELSECNILHRVLMKKHKCVV